MKFKIGEMVNIPMAFDSHHGIGIIFEISKFDTHVYAVQIDNNNWEWYQEDEIEKIILRNSFS